MASDLVVPVVKIENVREHKNSNNLDLCDILGWQVCIPKGKYKGGELVVYFPIDVLIPTEWSEKFGIKNYLKGSNKDRVGCVRLRGEPSFGVIQEIPADVNWVEGMNVADYFNCTKYTPPVRVHGAGCGDAAPYDETINPYFSKFTDVQNGRIYTDIFNEGEEVIFTEKIHGTNSRVGYINGKRVAASMSVIRKEPNDSNDYKTNPYWYPFTIDGVVNMLYDLSEDSNNVILYGEVYGRSIQTLDYGVSNYGFGYRAFGLKVDDRFLSWNEFEKICSQYNVPTVPVLYRGSFNVDIAKQYADGKSTLSDHMREGIVVYPVEERTHPKIGRVVLKYIGVEYYLSKHPDQDQTNI